MAPATHWRFRLYVWNVSSLGGFNGYRMRNSQIEKILLDNYVDFFDRAYFILRSSDDAADMVQEAMAVTMSAPFVNDPITYCNSVLRRLSFTTLRRKRQIMRIEDLDVSSMADRTDHHFSDHLWHLVNSLPEDMRALLIMHDVDDYSTTQLAQLTGMSTSYIRKKLQKAHKILKNQLLEE